MEGVASFSSAGRGQVCAVTNEGELYALNGGYDHNDDGTTTLRWNDRLAATGVKQAYCKGGIFYLDTNDVLYGFEYDEELGDPENGIAPGTKWEDVPEDFECPICGLDKASFEEE